MEIPDREKKDTCVNMKVLYLFTGFLEWHRFLEPETNTKRIDLMCLNAIRMVCYMITQKYICENQISPMHCWETILHEYFLVFSWSGLSAIYLKGKKIT